MENIVFCVCEKRLDCRKLGQGIADCQEVPGIGAAHNDPAVESFKIIDSGEEAAQVIPQPVVLKKHCHSLEAGAYPGYIPQGKKQPAFKETGSHGGGGIIQGVQQRPFPAAPDDCLHQLEVSPRGLVNNQDIFKVDGDEFFNVRTGCFLGFLHILQERPGGRDPLFHMITAEPSQVEGPEMFKQGFSGCF